MNSPLRPLIPTPLLVGLAACAMIPDAPSPERVALPQGTPVALGQAVEVGPMVAMPIEVVEDSRCPINARCIWAGRLVIEANIAGYSWGETVRLTLGEPHTTHGVTLALTSGSPAPETGGTIAPEDYRFTFERR